MLGYSGIKSWGFDGKLAMVVVGGDCLRGFTLHHYWTEREREKAAVRDGDREEGELMLSGSVVQGRRKRGQRTMPCWARGSAAELAKEQGAGVVAVIGLAWSSSTVLAQFGSNKVDIGLKPFPLPLPTFICKFSTSSSSLSFTISHFYSSSPPLAQHRRHIHLSNLSLAAALPNIATTDGSP